MFFLNRLKLVQNFNQCISWEDKYLYLIDLGKYLLKFPKKWYKKENQIFGCQSQVWIVIKKSKKEKIIFYGDSNSAIVKGLLVITFILYQNMNQDEIINFDIFSWINKMSLSKNLTTSRVQGLQSIINTIVFKIKNLE